MQKLKDDIHGGRVYIFIDASNLWSIQKSKKKPFDYAKLKAALISIFHSTDIKVYYYTAYPAEGTRTYSLDGKHKFFTFLSKGLDFVVRKKVLKRIFCLVGHDQIIQEKRNMDVEMTIDAVHFKNQYDTAVLMTGDSDFLSLVTYLKNDNKKVYIFSSANSISQELRTGGDGYFDLLRLEQDIWGGQLHHRADS
jgi:uncharacterized LabA/DUF88 family protein